MIVIGAKSTPCHVNDTSDFGQPQIWGRTPWPQSTRRGCLEGSHASSATTQSSYRPVKRGSREIEADELCQSRVIMSDLHDCDQ